jgi:hypothetical protein
MRNIFLMTEANSFQISRKLFVNWPVGKQTAEFASSFSKQLQ